MKIALLADVHANWPALEAVLKDIQKEKIREVWYLGDSLGYGPQPEKVVRAVQKRATRIIAGNYDLNVLKFLQKKINWKKTKDPAKYFLFEWTHRNISVQSRRYIRALPRQLKVRADGISFQLVHGSPLGIDDPLHPHTPVRRFKEVAANTKADVILCGHTHVFFVKKINRVTFINPGSVGRTFDGDVKASYAILLTDKGKLRVAHRKLRYDVQKNLNAMRRAKFPEDVIGSIATGRSLDDIRKEQGHPVSNTVLMNRVLRLARSCRYERRHSHQVARLSLMFFDNLQKLHQLPKEKKIILHAAAVLHDIGWIKGRYRHHKTGRDIILASALPLSLRDKMTIALVVRYHRRALPKDSHRYYGDLDIKHKDEIRKLASILRVADGLDRNHQNSVQDLTCRVFPREVRVGIRGRRFAETEKGAAEKKADLFQNIFKKKVCVTRDQKK